MQMIPLFKAKGVKGRIISQFWKKYQPPILKRQLGFCDSSAQVNQCKVFVVKSNFRFAFAFAGSMNRVTRFEPTVRLYNTSLPVSHQGNLSATPKLASSNSIQIAVSETAMSASVEEQADAPDHSRSRSADSTQPMDFSFYKAGLKSTCDFLAPATNRRQRADNIICSCRWFHQTLPNIGLILGLRTSNVPYSNTQDALKPS